MKRILPALLGLALLAFAGRTAAGSPGRTPEELARVMDALDNAVFDAFNRCDDPDQLARHEAYFDEGVEFYHDHGGVTWTRGEMIARTRDNACGRYRRQRVPGSLQVHEIRGYGAITRGAHLFCQAGTDRCDGEADFTMVWREREGHWQVTRVLSYGHRPAATP